MADIISGISSLFTAAIGWVADVGTTVVGSPILLMFATLPLVGLGVGFFKRLTSN